MMRLRPQTARAVAPKGKPHVSGLRRSFRCENSVILSVSSTIIALFLIYVAYVNIGPSLYQMACSGGYMGDQQACLAASATAVSPLTPGKVQTKQVSVPWDAVSDHGPTRGYLISHTVGELGNHMECLLTSVMGASMLNLTLVVPRVFPVYHKKHLALVKEDAYDEPFRDIDTKEAQEFPIGRMFDESAYKSMATLPREHYGAPMVDDAPDGLKKVTLGIPSTVWELSTTTGEKLNASVADWLKKMAEAEGRNKEIIESSKTKSNVYPIAYDAGTSLCFYALNPKYAETCENMHCQHMVRALQPNKVVKDMAQKVLAHISEQQTELHHKKWFALHFVHPDCKPGEGVYSEHLGAFLEKYVDKVNPSKRNLLYVISEDFSEKFRLSVTRYHFDVVTIADVFPQALERIPYNVLAQVDFEVALRSDVFFGRTFSAFDQWVHQRKNFEPADTRDGIGTGVFYGGKKPCDTEWS